MNEWISSNVNSRAFCGLIRSGVLKTLNKPNVKHHEFRGPKYMKQNELLVDLIYPFATSVERGKVPKVTDRQASIGSARHR